MPHYNIDRTRFPELKGNDLPRFIEFMKVEFDAYLNDNGKSLYAHNDGDSHWFTQQYLDGKKGKGLYQDFFKKKKAR